MSASAPSRAACASAGSICTSTVPAVTSPPSSKPGASATTRPAAAVRNSSRRRLSTRPKAVSCGVTAPNSALTTLTANTRSRAGGALRSSDRRLWIAEATICTANSSNAAVSAARKTPNTVCRKKRISHPFQAGKPGRAPDFRRRVYQLVQSYTRLHAAADHFRLTSCANVRQGGA